MDIRFILAPPATTIIRLSLSKYVNIRTEDNRNATGAIVEEAASDQPTPGVIITINDLLSYKLDVCKWLVYRVTRWHERTLYLKLSIVLKARSLIVYRNKLPIF